MSEGTSPSTTIAVDQQVGTTDHSQVIGIKVRTMNVSGNAYLAARLPEAYADEVTV
jgi:hypothetical protein